ncbi:biotin synthase BioB [Insolitispirillum peregrinum]|uniref:biotin synthase BioB n=1 Tax=Insolitispirillum peregrinum TaxID=80876 RepID=UPI0036130091
MTLQTQISPSAPAAHSADRISDADLRHDWTKDEILALFDLPFMELVFRAAAVHREHFDPNVIQRSSLVNIKSGKCPEDCKYCSQSARNKAKLRVEPLMEVEDVVVCAEKAKANGATRLCMGAAWRSLKDQDLPKMVAMIKAVRGVGMQTCMTLGMVTHEQADALREAGLDYYNHNVDTSREYYPEVITSRTYDDRLKTLAAVRDAGIKVCSGGIVGMGESREDRAGMLHTLATLPTHPDSVPINMLVPIAGTPAYEAGQGAPGVDPLEFVRTIAVARLTMPASIVRLSAGRHAMDDSTQALAFLAGANSMFYGEELLTTENSAMNRDNALFDRLGLKGMAPNARD